MTRRILLSGGAAALLGVALALMAVVPAASRTSPPPLSIADLVLDGRFSEAETRSREFLAETERLHGADSLDAAAAMSRLVVTLAAAADPARLPEVRRLLRQALIIRERETGDHSLLTALSLNETAVALLRFAAVEEARAAAERCVAIRTIALGPDHRYVGHALYMLGEADRASGRFATAIARLERAREILEASPGAEGEHLANTLHYLGWLHWRVGDLAGARPLLQRALSIRETLLGPSDPSVAQTLMMLGSVLQREGDVDAAEEAVLRAYRIWESRSGPDHPYVARSLGSLAALKQEAGDLDAARALLGRALAIREKAPGPDRILVARTLAAIAGVEAARGRLSSAENIFRQALAIERRAPLPDGVALAGVLAGLARVRLAMGDAGEAIALSIEAERAARVFFLQSAAGLDDEGALRYTAVVPDGLDVALAALDGRAGDSRRVWDELVHSRDLILEASAANTRGGGEDGLEEVARALPPDSALVAYVRHQRPTFEARGPKPAFYTAFVLRRPGAAPAVVALGAAERVDRLVTDWRAAVGSDPRIRRGRESAVRAAGQALREAIWDPVENEVGGRRRVFIVPDGTIPLVTFAALPREDGRYLVETGPLVHYLVAERDLTRPARGRSGTPGLLVVGGVDYDDARARDTIDPSRGNGLRPACHAFDSMVFGPLYGSAGEVERIRSVMSGSADVTVLRGRDATEAALRDRASAARVIHLATHGWSIHDQCNPETRLPDALGEGPVGEDALLLTGIALAGANRRGVVGGLDDGMLTAREVANLDLKNLDWAVLSGCGTGLGQVMDGEGVLGLGRAFRAAGAATTIMSLWNVDDGAAVAWMEHLYRGKVAGRPVAEAVNGASRALLEAQRARGASTHPYFWASFIAVGDWR